MIRGAALKDGRAALRAAGVETAALDAELCLAAALGCERLSLLSAPDAEMSAPALARYSELIARRARHEPMAYITGSREFHGLDFAVSPATLIPRPDSEALIDAALATIETPEGSCSILDLGAGSGCLLLSLLHRLPQARGVGVDMSAAALEIAQANAERLSLAGRAVWRRGDWWAALEPGDGPFDLIVGNPPYIARAEIATLAPDVRAYEPHVALDGGADGLDAYRAIADGLAGHLAPGGRAIFEIGADQAADVSALFAAAGWRCGPPIRDLSGHARAIMVDASEKGLENTREAVTVRSARRGTGCDTHRPDFPNPGD